MTDHNAFDCCRWANGSPHHCNRTGVDARLELIDRLDGAIGGVLFNASNFPERVQARILGQDMQPLRTKILDAVLASLESEHD